MIAETDDNDHEDDVDGCDFALVEDEATLDAELPPAVGGMQVTAESFVDEDEVDACEMKFDTEEVTGDEELPVAVGGVA